MLWFESFYNHRLRQKEFHLLVGTPNELIGDLDCPICYNLPILSTSRGRFHRYLARLRKTPLSDPDEMKLLGEPLRDESSPLKNIRKTQNPIFLLETSQLGDSNETRSKIFRQEVSEFLGLKEELGDKIPKMGKPRKNRFENQTTSTKMINICDKEFLPLRHNLMEISRNASLWFRLYFLASDEVFVSSPDFFQELLEKWMIDPCLARSKEKEFVG